MRVCACVCKHACMRMFVYVGECVYICVYVYMCVCVCWGVYIHVSANSFSYNKFTSHNVFEELIPCYSGYFTHCI